MSVSSARPIAFYRSSNVFCNIFFWRQAEPRTLLPRNREISSLVQNMTATIIELGILIFHLFQKQRKKFFFSFILFYFQTYFGADIHFKQHITNPQCGKTTWYILKTDKCIYTNNLKYFSIFACSNSGSPTDASNIWIIDNSNFQNCLFYICPLWIIQKKYGKSSSLLFPSCHQI